MLTNTGFFKVSASPKSFCTKAFPPIISFSPTTSYSPTVAFSPTIPFSRGSLPISNPPTPIGRALTPPHNFPGRATKEEALDAILKNVQGEQVDAAEHASLNSEAGYVKKEESPQERELLAEKLRLFVSSNPSLNTSDACTPT